MNGKGAEKDLGVGRSMHLDMALRFVQMEAYTNRNDQRNLSTEWFTTNDGSHGKEWI
jgi:hypothetical protein